MATLEDLGQEQRDELALLARELSDNPETRKDFLRMSKKVRPNMPVPEVDLDDRLSGQEKKFGDEISALQNKLAEKDMREELGKRRQSLKDKGLAESDDDVAAIEKIMLEKNISNHETAAEYFTWMKQAAPSTPPSYNRNVIDPKTRTDLSAYWKNPQTAARDVAAQALTDFRKNPRAHGG